MRGRAAPSRRQAARAAAASRGRTPCLPIGGTRRRRTLGSPPWCCRAAWRSAASPSAATIQRRARGRRTPPEAGSSPRSPSLGGDAETAVRVGPVVLRDVARDAVARALVQVADHDLLVVEGELRDGARLEHRLRGLEGVAVL